MAGKKQAVGSTKKPLKKGGAPKKKKAVAAAGKENGKGEAETGDDSQIGHNSRIPSKKEMAGYFARLDKLHEEKAEKNAAFMSDIKGVYEEASSKFGSSRKIMRILYAQKKASESYADAIEEMESKERDDLDRLTLGAAKAFGNDTPFGAFLAGQASIRDLSEENIDEIKPADAPVVGKVKTKTAAEAAAEAIAAEARDITKEQTTH